MDQNQAIETLREARGEFPQSLVAQFDRRGSLSDKQWHWVVKLASARVSDTCVARASPRKKRSNSSSISPK